jgi:hypothetical protein
MDVHQLYLVLECMLLTSRSMFLPIVPEASLPP